MLEAVISGRINQLPIDAQLDTRDGPLVLAGPNGSGKTTLLRMLLGVRRPAAGRIVVGGTTLFDSARGIDVAVEERRLGYVPQDSALFPHMTVLQNVEFADHRGTLRDRRARRGRAEELLAEFGLAKMARRRPAELSGGEQQKVALARAIADDPRALLLDEPLSALDSVTRKSVRSFLMSYLRGLELPAIFVTHDPVDAVALGGRIAILEAGRIVQSGSWDELRARPASAFVRQFVAVAENPDTFGKR